MEEQSSSRVSDMSILKIDATDGSLVWKMAYTGASGAGGEGFS